MRPNWIVKSIRADGPIVRNGPVGAWRSPVSAPVWGTGGRGFKSRRPDQNLAGSRFPEKRLWETSGKQKSPQAGGIYMCAYVVA